MGRRGGAGPVGACAVAALACACVLACASEGASAPPTDAGPEGGAGFVGDAASDPPRVWADPYPENTAAVERTVADACAVLSACALAPASLSPLATSPPASASRGLFVVQRADGALASLEPERERPGEAPTPREVPYAADVALVRRTADRGGVLVCGAGGECRFTHDLAGAAAPRTEVLPAELAPVDAARSVSGERRKTWVAGSDLYVRGDGEATFRAVPGIGRPVRAVALVGRHLLAVGDAGFAAWVDGETLAVTPIAVEGAPDLVDVTVGRPVPVWFGRAADGRVVVGVNGIARTCDLGSPVVETGPALVTRDGTARWLRAWRPDDPCRGVRLGVTVDLAGSYACDLAEPLLVGSGGRVLADPAPSCVSEVP